jgi:hypothetical protein
MNTKKWILTAAICAGSVAGAAAQNTGTQSTQPPRQQDNYNRGQDTTGTMYNREGTRTGTQTDTERGNNTGTTRTGTQTDQERRTNTGTTRTGTQTDTERRNSTGTTGTGTNTNTNTNRNNNSGTTRDRSTDNTRTKDIKKQERRSSSRDTVRTNTDIR